MSKSVEDLSGQVFDRVHIISFNEEISLHTGYRYYNCVCDCGTEFVAIGKNIKARKTKSCGCLLKEHLNRVHKSRCNNERITVC